jgi:hypothetical protein
MEAEVGVTQRTSQGAQQPQEAKMGRVQFLP